MNKQELIEKYQYKLYEVCTNYGEYYRTIAYENILKDLEQLDEPQKPVVPQIVSDYIEYTKENEWDLIDAMKGVSYEDYDDLMKWFYKDDNQETFALAWINGFKVEKEKRYLVKMKSMDKEFTMLKLDKIRDNWYLGNDTEYSYTKVKHTRKELEGAGFGDVFDSPLFEVEEVQDDSKV